MARMPVRDPGDWAFAMRRLPVRFHETEHAVRRLARLVARLRQEARVLGQVVEQTRKRGKGEPTPGRVYSVHEPHIACITRNKAGKKHEYGVKVSLDILISS